MKTIFKYPIETTDQQVLMLPEGAEILTVQIQKSSPVIYALVESESNKYAKCTIEIYGTGHVLKDPDTLHYIGTYQLFNGDLVFHAFERK